MEMVNSHDKGSSDIYCKSSEGKLVIDVESQ